MINLEYALEAFKEYRRKYPNTERIDLKVAHMRRVMLNNINLAKELNLPDEDIKLAGLIGLLHDFGRFEQVRRFDTFVDSQSINHAMFSSEQLFEEGLIRKFILDNKYDNIIKSAIENHNKFEIDKSVSGRELLHSQLIRDSDKVDIYVQVLESDPNLVFDGPYHLDDTISANVLRSFNGRECVKTQDMRCKADDLVRKIALIYGLYFPQSLRPISDQDLITKLTTHFKRSFRLPQTTVDIIDFVSTSANSYIDEQIKRSKPREDLYR